MTSHTNADILALLERAPGKRPQFLGDASLDHLFAMVMELATQLWVLRERLYVHEDIARRSGAIAGDAIESWTASEEQAAELAEMRAAMIRELFRTVLARDPGVAMPDHTADPVPPAPMRTVDR